MSKVILTKLGRFLKVGEDDMGYQRISNSFSLPYRYENINSHDIEL